MCIANENGIDIFISYARENKYEAEMLAQALMRQGWSVWYDAVLLAGENWEKSVETALESSRAVIVLWSKAALQSDWVRAEAESARCRGVVFPILLEECQLPVVFRTIQTTNLQNWDGSISHSGFIELIKSLSTFFGKSFSAAPLIVRNHHSRFRTISLLTALIVVPIITVLILFFIKVPQTSITLDATVSQLGFKLDQTGEIFDLMVLQELRISGIQEIKIPREKNVNNTQRKAYSINTDKFTLKNSISPGSITLEPILVNAGTRLQLSHAPNFKELSLGITGFKDFIRINIMGEVIIEHPPSTHFIADYGSPKPLVISGDGHDIDILMTPIAVPMPLLSTSLSIRDLTLFRIDEKISLTSTRISQASTIISGAIKFELLGRRTINLNPNELIRFDKLTGKITSLTIGNEGISLQFHGTASTIDRCIDNTCESEIPSRWEWLLERYLLFVYIIAIIYILAAVFILIKYGRKVPH